MHCLSRYEALGKFREHSNKSQNDCSSFEIPQRAAQIRRFPRELVTLRVVRFVLKITHLAFSMEPLVVSYPYYGSCKFCGVPNHDGLVAH